MFCRILNLQKNNSRLKLFKRIALPFKRISFRLNG